MDKKELVNSEMSYALKITYFTRGIQEFPCRRHKDPTNPRRIFEECKTPRKIKSGNKTDIYADWSFTDDEWCFSKCGTVRGEHQIFSIDVSYLSKKIQWEVYLRKRSLDLMKQDLEQHPNNLGIFELHKENEKVSQTLEFFYKTKRILEPPIIKV